MTTKIFESFNTAQALLNQALSPIVESVANQPVLHLKNAKNKREVEEKFKSIGIKFRPSYWRDPNSFSASESKKLRDLSPIDIKDMCEYFKSNRFAMHYIGEQRQRMYENIEEYIKLLEDPNFTELYEIAKDNKSLESDLENAKLTLFKKTKNQSDLPKDWSPTARYVIDAYSIGDGEFGDVLMSLFLEKNHDEKEYKEILPYMVPYSTSPVVITETLKHLNNISWTKFTEETSRANKTAFDQMMNWGFEHAKKNPSWFSNGKLKGTTVTRDIFDEELRSSIVSHKGMTSRLATGKEGSLG